MRADGVAVGVLRKLGDRAVALALQNVLGDLFASLAIAVAHYQYKVRRR